MLKACHALVVVAVLTGSVAAASTNELIARVKAVGKEGKGNPEAAAAWKELIELRVGALLEILAAMDDDNPLASNWLRTAFDAIAEKTSAGGGELPTGDLNKIVSDTSKPRCARRLAYEWLVRINPKTPAALLPGMLNDPSPELRRDAVALATKKAQELLDKGDKGAALEAFRKAFAGACDQDQVDALAKKLKELGETKDLAAHFGMVTRWQLVAPFDNTGGIGFKAVYPPEKGVDLTAVYRGKAGAEAKWVEHTTADAYGLVDLNKLLGKQKDVVGYAYAVIDSPRDQLVQVRAGCITALKVFVNGQEVFGREEYHHGMRLDQYAATAKLKAGRNELLLKICQNNQTDSWAQDWKFQVRLTDPAGAAVAWKRADAKAKP